PVCVDAATAPGAPHGLHRREPRPRRPRGRVAPPPVRRCRGPVDAAADRDRRGCADRRDRALVRGRHRDDTRRRRSGPRGVAARLPAARALRRRPRPFAPRAAERNEEARAHAEARIFAGAAGFISGHTGEAELTSLGRGFYANAGVSGSRLRPRAARFGLPPVYVAERTVSWIELEAGADLHVRLVRAQVDEPG